MDPTERKPLFIFGSGTSPAPNVKELTAFAIDARLYRGGDGMYYLADENDPPQPGEETARWFLREIREDIAAYQNRPLDAVTYEDIANVCVQLHKETGSRRNPALWPYRESLLRRLHAKFPDAKLGELAWDSVDRIKWGVRLALSQCTKQPDALERFNGVMIEPLVSATIVTLNHDLYVEQILGARAKLGFQSDTFGGEFFCPDGLAKDFDFQLLKLHGSIDWFWHAESGRYQRLSDLRDLDVDDSPVLLAGTLSKLEDYSFSIFPWLWAEFQNALRKTRRVIVSGYGFKDAGLNARLRSWLIHFPTARILVIHPNPSTLVAETSREKVDAIGGFFENVADVAAEKQNAATSERIVFLPIGFEDASSQKWSSLISEFAKQDRS